MSCKSKTFPLWVGGCALVKTIRLDHKTRRILGMPKHGKKYLEMAKAVDRDKLYDPQEAIELLKNIVKANYDHTV